MGGELSGWQDQGRLETSLETDIHLQVFQKSHVGSLGIHLLYLRGSCEHPVPPEQQRPLKLQLRQQPAFHFHYGKKKVTIFFCPF